MSEAISAIEGVTTRAIALALDAANMNHQAIASNIVNINTPNHVPLKVNFEELMEQVRNQIEGSGSLEASLLAGLKVQLEPAVDSHGQPEKIRLDVEMIKLAQNTAHYQALVKGLNKHFAMMASAVREGKQ